MKIRWIGAAAAGVGLAAALGCSSTGPGQSCDGSGAAADVSATSSNTFSPAEVTIQAGQSVCWKNTDSANHTVTADVGGFDAVLTGGGVFIRTISVPGAYPYHCELHPGMVGLVTVQ